MNIQIALQNNILFRFFYTFLTIQDKNISMYRIISEFDGCATVQSVF